MTASDRSRTYVHWVATSCLNHLATEAEGGERKNTNKNLSPWNKTPLTMSNLS